MVTDDTAPSFRPYIVTNYIIYSRKFDIGFFNVFKAKICIIFLKNHVEQSPGEIVL